MPSVDEPSALMRTLPRRFRRNVLTTYLTMVVSAAQVLLITPLLVRGLGPERYGIWSLVASFGLFAVLLDLGLASATTRYVAHYEELGDRPLLARTINVSFWILLGLGTLVLLAGVVFAPLFPKLFSVPGEETAASVLVLLTAASIALAVVGGTATGRSCRTAALHLPQPHLHAGRDRSGDRVRGRPLARGTARRGWGSSWSRSCWPSRRHGFSRSGTTSRT